MPRSKLRTESGAKNANQNNQNKDWHHHVQDAILFSDEYKSAIFSFKNDTLTITATNPDIGESKEDMVINFNRDVIEAAFNPKYFIDTLGLINGDTVVLYIKDNESPCLLEGMDNKNFISVIMPMRI